ncbi:MAG: hypothetical protein HY273_09775 [Gammaproteobacteria bacterium]|nr:hypothetical protein [Gammaproteobacteria bacterium]
MTAWRVTLCCALGTLLACSSNNSDQAGPSATTTNATTAIGYFVDSYVVGLGYRSGSQTGVTDGSGRFSYEVNQPVTFFVGDIILGQAPGAEIITPVELVAGANDETNVTVVNISRFLQTLDENADPTDNIHIPDAFRSAASGVELNFESPAFDREATSVVAAISGGMRATLVSSADAVKHLSKTLMALRTGKYSGTSSGGDVGAWEFTVDEVGALSGSLWSYLLGKDLPVAGQVSTNGQVTAKAGGMETNISMQATIGRDGTLSGTWVNGTTGSQSTVLGKRTQLISDPDLSTGKTLYASLMADFAYYESQEITLSSPDIAENGAVIPVKVKFPSNVGTLWILAEGNDENVAAKIDYLVPSHNGVAGVRLKMQQSGNIIAAFVDVNNNVMAARRVTKVTVGGSPAVGTPDYFPALAPDFARYRAVAGTPSGLLQALFFAPMDLVDYVTRVRVRVDAIPIAVVYFTPYIAKNPYLEVAFPPAAKSIVVDIAATGDRSLVTDVPIQ